MNAPKVEVRNLKVFFGREMALKGVSLDVATNRILGVIGPSGSAKTTFLRALNRMNELKAGCRTEGQVLMDGEDIYGFPGTPQLFEASRHGLRDAGAPADECLRQRGLWPSPWPSAKARESLCDSLG